MPRARIERHAARFERAQAVDGGGDGEGQFLRFRAAGIVDDAPVGDRERPAKSLLGEIAHHAGAMLFDSSLHGRGLVPVAAKPPIGLMLARRSTDAGEILRLPLARRNVARRCVSAG